MSATGASPMYYDFDMMQEMQVTTGGADASQQTGGVGINFVTRSGTNRFKGSGRIYNTNDAFEADNVTDEIRAQGAGSGAPIQNINDFGFEVGGPIKRDKLWYWGSYGKQDVKVGVVNFYKPTPTCRPPGVPVGADRGDARQHRSDPRLPGDRPDDARQLQRQADLVGGPEQQVQLPEHLGRQSAQRPGRVRHAADRNRLPAEEYRRARPAPGDGTRVQCRSGRRAISTSSTIAC